MSTALYRRYRPETFADVIGQEHVTEPLMAAIDKDRINHAYLFSGPRGCGKTTSARILARCLNCAQGPTSTPCGVCDSCVELARNGSGSLDVIEIDAASHGGVDDARDLRERATFAPVRDRFKIFIIDEAHMVTSAGFNALLKIVEEPPEHILFIFATTEPDKVIGTIRSRTHHYPFRLVPPEPLMAYLELLCRQENVPVAPGVLSLVVRAGGGSVRDSLSVLDQLMAGAGETGLDYELAVSLLGYTHATLLDDVVDSVAAGDAATVFNAVDRVIQTGHDPRRFVEDLLERFRDLIVINAVPEGAASILRGVPDDQLNRMRTQANQLGAGELSRAADVTNAALNEMTGATSPRLHLELLCARLLLPAADASVRGTLARVDRIERRLEYAAGTPAADGGSEPAAAPETAAEPAKPARPRLDGVPRTAEEAAARWSLPVADPAAPAVPAAAGTPAVPAAAQPKTPATDSSPDWGGNWGVSTDSAFAAPAPEAPTATRPAPGAPDATPGAPAAAGAPGSPGDPSASGTPGTPGPGHLPGATLAPDAAGTPGAPGAPGAEGDQNSTGSADATAAPGAPVPGTSTPDAPASPAARGERPAARERSFDGPAPQAGPAGQGSPVDGGAPRSGQAPQAQERSQGRPAGSAPGQQGPTGEPFRQPTADGRQQPEQRSSPQSPAHTPGGPDQPQQGSRQPAPDRQGQSTASGGNVEMIRRAWPEIMNEVAHIKRATWLIVNVSAKPRSFEGNQLVLAFVNQGNAIGFQRGPHMDNVKQAIHKVLGLTCSIEAVHDAGGAGESGPKVPARTAGPGSSPSPASPAPERADSPPTQDDARQHAGGTPTAGPGASSPPAGAAPQHAGAAGVAPVAPSSPTGRGPHDSGVSAPAHSAAGHARPGDAPTPSAGRSDAATVGSPTPSAAGDPRPGPAPTTGSAAHEGTASAPEPAGDTHRPDRAVTADGTAAPSAAARGTAGDAPTSHGAKDPRAAGGADRGTRPAEQRPAPGAETVGAWDPSMSDESWALVEPPEEAFDPGPSWASVPEDPFDRRADGARGTGGAGGARQRTTPAPAPAPAPAPNETGGRGVNPQRSPRPAMSQGPSAPGPRTVPEGTAAGPAPTPTASRSVVWSPPDAAPPTSGGDRAEPSSPGAAPAEPETAHQAPAARTAPVEPRKPVVPRFAAPGPAPAVPDAAVRDAAPDGGAGPDRQVAAGDVRQKPVSRYQQLLDEAARKRAEEAAATRGTVDLRFVEDEPSADDETIEESALVGRTAIERILNGRLIEERTVDGQ
ncbi:DNA polymerase III subunit gamma and tau [Arthrobacter sp. Ld5]|uniref:DNA polymerase III subunit gamma and tau n=1 Tax=Arthrobacter sp. Ld5 TaxID=649152 RepID=UPI003EBC5705